MRNGCAKETFRETVIRDANRDNAMQNEDLGSDRFYVRGD